MKRLLSPKFSDLELDDQQRILENDLEQLNSAMHEIVEKLPKCYLVNVLK